MFAATFIIVFCYRDCEIAALLLRTCNISSCFNAFFLFAFCIFLYYIGDAFFFSTIYIHSFVVYFFSSITVTVYYSVHADPVWTPIYKIFFALLYYTLRSSV